MKACGPNTAVIAEGAGRIAARIALSRQAREDEVVVAEGVVDVLAGTAEVDNSNGILAVAFFTDSRAVVRASFDHGENVQVIIRRAKS